MSLMFENCELKVLSMSEVSLNGTKVPISIFFQQIAHYLNETSSEYKSHIRSMLDTIEVIIGFGHSSLRFVMDKPDQHPPTQKNLVIEGKKFMSNEVPSLIWYLVTNTNIESVFDPRYSFFSELSKIVNVSH